MRKLCEHHYTGDSHCHSIPETDCESTFKVARNKKRIVQFLIIIFLLVCITITAFIIYDVSKPESKYKSTFYDVNQEKSGDLIINPKKGTAHTNTIIFLHDYGTDNENLFNLFSKPGENGQAFALSTSRIVLPNASRIKISALKGQIPDTKRSWFNFYESLEIFKPTASKTLVSTFD